jgi:hypothetical protein
MGVQKHQIHLEHGTCQFYGLFPYDELIGREPLVWSLMVLRMRECC